MSRIYQTMADAARELNSGGVLLLPTDTLPGLHARADQTTAVKRINTLKGRSIAKPLLLLAADMQQVSQVVSWMSARQIALCDRCWPGPFSLIFDARADFPTGVVAENGSVAIRIPDLEPLRKLLRVVGFPLASTSVNLTGQAPCKTLADAVDLLATEVDGVWPEPGETEADSMDAQPSAVVDVRHWPPMLVRKGPRPLPLPGTSRGGAS